MTVAAAPVKQLVPGHLHMAGWALQVNKLSFPFKLPPSFHLQNSLCAKKRKA
jgi:hypothetical protein